MPGKGQFTHRHTTAPSPDLGVGQFVLADQQTEGSVCQFPVRPGSYVTKRERCPLLQTVGAVCRNRDELFGLHFYLFGQNADAAGGVVSENLIGIAVAVRGAVAEHNRPVAFGNGIDLCAALVDPDHTGIADDDLVLTARQADVDGTAVQGVAHIALETAEERAYQGLVGRRFIELVGLAYQFRGHRFGAFLAGVQDPSVALDSHG